MVKVSFSNETAKPLDLMIEPWATTIAIEPGSKFAVIYPAPEGRMDTSFTEIHADVVRFWCEGETFDVEVDGKIILT